jgi:lipid A 4'-phosphatase
MLERILFVILVAVFAAVFYFYPVLDLDASSVFYREGEGFYLKDKPWVYAIYKAVPVICFVFIFASLLFGLKKLISTKSINPKHYRKIIYVTLVCLIGPGFIVHNVFKDNFGRPRPHQIEQFGGDAHFQKPFVISNECQKNCSFPSGHAAVGFMFFALAFLYVGYARAWLLGLSIFLGLVVGLIRMIQGGHFLSDVIFSGIVVYATAYVLDIIIKPRNTQ